LYVVYVVLVLPRNMCCEAHTYVALCRYEKNEFKCDFRIYNW